MIKDLYMYAGLIPTYADLRLFLLAILFLQIQPKCV